MPEVKINHFIQEETCCDWFDMKIQIFHCKFDLHYYDDCLFNFLDVDFPNSLSRAVPKRRAEFLAGRYCAIQSLKNLNFYDVQIPIGKNKNPVWPIGIIGSISHSNTEAFSVACSLSLSGIGIDIEDYISYEVAMEIKYQIASDAELELISNRNESFSALFTILFSVKESFFKAAYLSVGRYFDFDTVRIANINTNKQTLLLEMNITLNESLIKGRLINAHYRILPNNKVITLVTLIQSE